MKRPDDTSKLFHDAFAFRQQIEPPYVFDNAHTPLPLVVKTYTIDGDKKLAPRPQVSPQQQMINLWKQTFELEALQ